MARIRTIKPEFFTSEQVASLSIPARLLFVGMWCFCDDGGVHPANAARLRLEVFPGGEPDLPGVQGLVDELLAQGLIVEYQADGQTFWAIPTWAHHQRIDRPTLRYPALKSTSPRRALDDSSTNTRRALDEPSRRNGMELEWKGVREDNVGQGPDVSSPLSDHRSPAPAASSTTGTDGDTVAAGRESPAALPLHPDEQEADTESVEESATSEPPAEKPGSSRDAAVQHLLAAWRSTPRMPKIRVEPKGGDLHALWRILQKHPLGELDEAISNYGKILSDPVNYIQPPRRTFTDFLKDEGAYARFLPKADPLAFFRRKTALPIGTARPEDVDVVVQNMGVVNQVGLDAEAQIVRALAVMNVVSEMNRILGTAYSPKTKDTARAIATRLHEGASVADCELVVRHQHREWKDEPKMARHLCPTTLFRQANFEKYLQAAKAAAAQPTGTVYGPTCRNGIPHPFDLANELIRNRKAEPAPPPAAPCGPDEEQDEESDNDA